ncbi:hypothetical protein G3N55_00015 [Dissulfurirhabdus thermomarina]|uniref:Uncharacterized protein n=1 Tax=Dissulfurirhabdus thermomarina TaxID=1765737 RepID=A0A6N9TN72_DISTH|nr:hypothetical protein [Dissulfurirhabdus thermomarina]NDY41234.1 hypothetical protein [Dissulfurirhabdus thermomarina]
MRTTRGDSIRRWLLVTAMLSAVCSMGCARRDVVVIPADRMIRPLPDGNYEVTPAWLQERYRLERWQAEELKRCRQR